jgi:hypothetical protein
MSATGKRGAVLQFEIDRKRWIDTESFHGGYKETAAERLYAMAKTAVCDTIHLGGTFVLVATPNKITMVQRPDAEEL